MYKNYIIDKFHNEYSNYTLFLNDILGTNLFRLDKQKETTEKIHLYRIGVNHYSCTLFKNTNLLHIFSDSLGTEKTDYNHYSFLKEFRFNNDKQETINYLKQLLNIESDYNSYIPKHEFENYIPKVENKPKYEFVNGTDYKDLEFGNVETSFNNNIAYEFQRIFHVTTSNQFINKFEKNSENWNWLQYLKREKIGLEQLIKHIGTGYTFSCGHFKDNYLTNANYLYSCTFGIDFDNSIKKVKVIDKYITFNDFINLGELKELNCIFVYTSASHTDNWHKFRAIFDFGKIVYNRNLRQEILDYTYNILKKYCVIDEQCKDDKRFWYGNNNAEIIDMTSGQLYNFNNGVLL